MVGAPFTIVTVQFVDPQLFGPRRAHSYRKTSVP